MGRKRKKSKNSFTRFVLSALVLIFILGFGIAQINARRTATSNNPELIAQADQSAAREAFLQEIAPIAQEMRDAHGILPSIILAQAALESDFGKSLLSARYNNLFGIKSFGHPQSVALNTQEFLDGEWITYSGEFRVYNSFRESIEDHANLMVNGVTWNPALYHGVITAQNYAEAAVALQEAGYATDPEYANKLIAMVRQFNLTRFD